MTSRRPAASSEATPPGRSPSRPPGAREPGTGADPGSRQFASGLLIVFLGALLLRLIYLWELRDADVSHILVGDGYRYDRWAREIVGGRWLGDSPFYQAPLYPYFLAAVYRLLAPSPLAVRLVQALLGATACALLTVSGRAFFSPAVGLIAGGILAAYAPAIFYDGLIQKAALDLLLAAALLWLLAGRGPEARAVRIVAAGLTLGLLCLTRENALALVPVIGAWLLVAGPARPAHRRLACASLFLAGVGLVLCPVALRNRAVGGEWFLTTAQFGPNFFIGNGAGASGLYAPLRPGRGDARLERQDATQLAQAALGRTLTAGEVSRYWTGRALADIGASPDRWLRLLGWKLALTWNGREIVDSEDPSVYADSSVLLRGLGRLVHFGSVAPLAIAGLWLTRARWRRLWLLHAILAAVTASVVLFYVFGRYRYLLVPVVVLFAAAGIRGVLEAWRAHRVRELVVGGGILALAALGVNLPLVRDTTARAVMYRNMGATLGREGMLEEAIGYYRKAVGASPTYVEARLSLARALGALGRRDEAAGEYLAALALRPGLREAETGLGALLGEAPGRPVPPAAPR